MVNILRNLLVVIEKSAADAIKVSSKKIIQKTAEATGDLFGNKIVGAVAKSYDSRITKV